MKKFLLGTAALVAIGVPAIAADMPARPIARPAPAWGLNYKFDLGKAPVAVYK
jgi:opacity protein-like surface antigen